MSGAWTAWPAPAKLNLFLHIVGRRADGYHLLQTVFQLLDWGDTVHLRRRDDGAIRLAAELPAYLREDDLCLRAARLLRERTGASRGRRHRVREAHPLGRRTRGRQLGRGDGPRRAERIVATGLQRR